MRRFLPFLFLIAPAAWAACQGDARHFVPDHAKSVILLGHGLNNPPSLMSELAVDLCRADFEVYLLALKGHDPEHPDTDINSVTAADWLADVERDLKQAQTFATAKKLPLDFVGFSLSALVFESYMNLHPGSFAVSRVAYLAPAIGIKPYVHLIRLLPFSDAHMLPSLNRPDSRANTGTSMAAYRALFSLRSQLFDTKMTAFTAPHLVLLSQGDELVDIMATRNLKKDYKLTHWKLLSFKKSAAGREHSHWHLVVNRASAGPAIYGDLLASLTLFLDPAHEAKTEVFPNSMKSVED